jgi:hypothetical protein
MHIPVIVNKWGRQGHALQLREDGKSEAEKGLETARPRAVLGAPPKRYAEIVIRR